ncbi:MAG TPA: DUF4349 domain-containing protein [Gemmatimonadales bacterium]|nr:DUF4349 domain-containing protein [Gemmatimonadales bacterium]
MRRFIIVVALVASSACSGSVARKVQPSADSVRLDRTVVLGRAARAAAASVTTGAEERLREDATLFPRTSVTPEMVIRTGQASIEVDSLERAVAQVRLLAGRVGGYIANTTMQTGRGELRSASLEVKLPADRFDDGLSGLAAIGKIESVNVTAEDVGEEFTDVTARMANARRLESRLIDLLAARTGKLKDVLEVEQALARVREEIERYEGRLRYLRAHIALSTLTIYVHEPVPVVGHAGSSVIGEAFKQAWRNFVGLVALGIRSLGVVLPFGTVAVIAWFAVQRRRKLSATRP